MNSGKESNLHHAILIKEKRVLLLDFDILQMFPDIYIYIHLHYFLSKVPKIGRTHSWLKGLHCLQVYLMPQCAISMIGSQL